MKTADWIAAALVVSVPLGAGVIAAAAGVWNDFRRRQTGAHEKNALDLPRPDYSS